MIHYVINMDGLEEIESALGMAKDKSKLVLRAAINNSAKEVERRMLKDASKRYALHEGGMKAYKAVTKTSKARTGNLQAIITAKDKAALDLYEYKLSDRALYPGGRGAPKWLKAKQLKGEKLKRLALRPGGGGDQYKAFVVKYNGSSGHTAIAQRVPGTHMKGKPEKEAIRSLYATSKPKAEEVVYKMNIDADVHSILMRNIQEQIARFVK